MLVFPNAKINLGLNVLRKREDGYHDIESCFYPIGLADILEFVPQKGSTSFVSTGILIPGDAGENLCVKAWELLAADFDIPTVNIHLHKIIPIGAGLGGGSSDGAFMLKALNEFFGLNLTVQELQNYAARLGSDCAFFIENKPSIALGRGEVLEPIELELAQYRIALINPGLHVSTPEAYSGIAPGVPLHQIPEILKQPVVSWQASLRNDFENTVFKKYPLINEIKEQLYALGAIFALMSGSGSSVYAFFDGQVSDELESAFKDYFVWIQQ